jgi:hypothetical protein
MKQGLQRWRLRTSRCDGFVEHWLQSWEVMMRVYEVVDAGMGVDIKSGWEA